MKPLRIGIIGAQFAARLHLKAYEGNLKGGEEIGLKSVTAEVGRHTQMDSFRKESKNGSSAPGRTWKTGRR